MKVPKAPGVDLLSPTPPPLDLCFGKSLPTKKFPLVPRFSPRSPLCPSLPDTPKCKFIFFFFEKPTFPASHSLTFCLFGHSPLFSHFPLCPPSTLFFPLFFIFDSDFSACGLGSSMDPQFGRRQLREFLTPFCLTIFFLLFPII